MTARVPSLPSIPFPHSSVARPNWRQGLIRWPRPFSTITLSHWAQPQVSDPFRRFVAKHQILLNGKLAAEMPPWRWPSLYVNNWKCELISELFTQHLHLWQASNCKLCWQLFTRRQDYKPLSTHSPTLLWRVGNCSCHSSLPACNQLWTRLISKPHHSHSRIPGYSMLVLPYPATIFGLSHPQNTLPLNWKEFPDLAAMLHLSRQVQVLESTLPS